MCIDDADNLYLTDAADCQYRRIVTHEDLFSPDDILEGPDGAMYVVVSQLPHMPPLNEGKDRSQPPFVVVRFRPEDRRHDEVART